MKNEKWTEDLYLFRMKPAPPKKDDLQEYIALYCPEKDEKYLNSFFIITSLGSTQSLCKPCRKPLCKGILPI